MYTLNIPPIHTLPHPTLTTSSESMGICRHNYILWHDIVLSLTGVLIAEVVYADYQMGECDVGPLFVAQCHVWFALQWINTTLACFLCHGWAI